jgi:hypothetical protein
VAEFESVAEPLLVELGCEIADPAFGLPGSRLGPNPDDRGFSYGVFSDVAISFCTFHRFAARRKRRSIGEPGNHLWIPHDKERVHADHHAR